MEMRMGRILSAFLILLTGQASMARPQSAAPAEPEYVNQFFVLGDGGQLIALERQPMHHSIKRKNIPFVKVNIEGRDDIDGGPASPVHVGATPHFVVKMRIGERDPTTLMHLVQFKVDKQGRYIISSDHQGYVFTNGKSSGPQGDAVQLKITKYGQDSLEVEPTHPLPTGEYALLVTQQTADCFSVDTGLPASVGSGGGTAQSVPSKMAPPAWKLKPVQHPQATTDIYEATLAGTAETGGKHGAAQLDITCTVNRYTGDAETTASLSAALKLRREMVAFPTGSLTCEGDGANGAPFLRSQLSTNPELTRNVCFDGAAATDLKAVMSFGLSYEEPAISAILQAPASPLSLKLGPPDGSSGGLASGFQLPANGSDVLAAFDPCLKTIDAQRKKEADAIVAACPSLPNKTLAAVDVLIGPAMKKLAKDTENDIGEAWDIPKPTKSRPTVPRLTLACAYKDATNGTGSDSSAKSVPATTLKKQVPIPSTAKSCVFREDPYTNDPYGNCSR